MELALLVVQVTPVSLLAAGLDRVVAVVAGVTLAVVFSTTVPLAWWSLGVLIMVSLVIGTALRLRNNLIEVAISAMLVLGVGSLDAESAGWERITVTLVGAAVGVATNLLVPPQVPIADAGRAIDDLAGDLARLLRTAADELGELRGRGQDVAVRAETWLDRASTVNHDIPNVGAALLRAEQGRRLNVRAVGRPDAGPGLRQGLEAVEHSAVAIRGMFRAVHDATSDATWPEDEVGENMALLARTTGVFGETAAGVTLGGLPAEAVGPLRDVAARSAVARTQSGRAELAWLDGLVAAARGDAATLAAHRATLAATVFGQRFRDLIQYHFESAATPSS